MAQRFVNSNSSIGSDSNNGLTTASPLLTIQRGVNLSSSGDKISLFGGFKFFEEVNTNKSGLSFDSYGNSQKAEWTGFLPLSGWVNLGGGRWEATASALLSTVKQLRIDNAQQEKGRFPRRNAPNDGTLVISGGGAGTVTNSSINGMGLNGAEVVVRTSSYTYDVGQITSHVGGTLTFTGAMTYTPSNGYGFFVQNHISLLAQTGDWMYNPSTKKVTVFFEGADNPNNYMIEASAKDTLFNMTWGPQDFTFENLVFSGSNGHACRLYGGTIYNYNNVDFKNIGANAINSDNSTYVDVDHCTFEWCNNAGVFLKNETFYGKVRNSNFYKIGTIQGAYISGAVGQAYGIQLPHAGSEASNNVLDQIGYIGIRFGGDNTKVLRNHVKNFCSEMTDGSALYARNGSNSSPDWVNVECSHNIVEDSLGTGGGTPFSGQQEGIYLDDWCGGVTVSHNYVARVKGKALFIHNNRNVKFLNNTVFDCEYGFYSQSDALTNPRTRGVVFQGNRIISAHNDPQYMVRLASAYSDDLALFSETPGDFNNNTYYSLAGLSGTSFVYQSGAGNNHKSFSLWQAAYGYDADSLFVPITLADVEKFRTEINPTANTVNIPLLDGTYTDLTGETLGSSLSLPPYGADVIIKISESPIPPSSTTIKDAYANGFSYDAVLDEDPTIPAFAGIIQGESQMDNPTTDVVWDALTGSAKFLMDFERPTQTGSTIAGRTEQTTRYPALMEAEEMWFSARYEFAIGTVPDPEEETIYQWHTGDIGGSPNFSIKRKNGRFVVYLWIGSGFLNQMAFDIGESTDGIKHSLVVRLKMHPTAGQLTVWKDGLLARCHNPLTGAEWIVPTTPPGGGITNDYTAYPELGSIQQTSGGASLLVWNGKTARGTYPNPTKYPKWGFYKSAWGTRYNSDKSIKPEAYIEGNSLYVAPEFREKISYIDNVKFETRVNEFTNLEIYKSLDANGADPLETPVWWDPNPPSDVITVRLRARITEE